MRRLIRGVFQVLLACLVGPGLASGRPSAPKPHPTVARYLTPKLGRTWPVENAAISLGHATFLLQRGEVTELLVESRVAGLYFNGTGALDFLDVDPVGHAVLTHNLAKGSRIRTQAGPQGLSLGENFSEGVFWAWEVPEFPQAPTPGAHGPSSATEEAWKTFSARFGDSEGPSFPAQAMTFRELNASRQPFLAAHLKGSRSPLVYRFDGELTGLETLAIWKEGTEIPLSRQTLGWDRRHPVAPLITLSHLEVSLDARDPDHAVLEVEETLVPARPFQALQLDLMGPWIDPISKVFQGGALAVRDEGGTELPFDHRRDQVLIELKTPCEAGKPLKLRFRIEGDILYRPTMATYWKLGVFPWFPQPELAGQGYTVHATARVKPPYVPILPGTVIRRVQQPEEALLETRIERPVPFFVMDAGRFALHEEVKGDRTVTVATFRGTRANTERLARMAHQYIQLYELMLGPFPFKNFNIIHQMEYGYGQAPPGTMYITDEAFDTVSSVANQVYSRGVNHRFAHEIAHQYWGTAVRMPSFEEQWLTESFAEYCSALAIRRTKGHGEPKFEELVNEWKREAREAAPKATIPTANLLRDTANPVEQHAARQALIYDKGALILHRLNLEMGDKAFFTMMQTLIRSFNGGCVTTQDVTELASLLAKKDFNELFDRCYWGTEMP